MTAAVRTAAAVMAVLLTLAACGRRGTALVLRDRETGSICLELPAREGFSFSVTFTHSVNRTDVTEIYTVEDGKLFLTGCVYYDFGAGVATELEDGWSLSYGENGEMMISGIHRELPQLIYVVGTVSDHILEANGEEYSLRALCGQNAEVAFEIN